MYPMIFRQSAQTLQTLTLLVSILFLSACASHPSASHRRSLDVQTKMSAVIFLDPVPATEQSIFLQIKNTSGYAVCDLEASLRKALEKKGYRIVETPEQAHYLLQAQILHIGLWDRQHAEQARIQGFGAALGDVTSGTSLDAHAEKAYSLLSDLQISERVGKTVEVKQKAPPKRKQSPSAAQAVVATETVHWKRYQSRVLSVIPCCHSRDLCDEAYRGKWQGGDTVAQTHLKDNKAVRALVAGLVRTLTGIF